MASLEMNIRQTNADFQAIKNKIVESGVEVAKGTPTSEYAGKVSEVYEAGQKSEYDAFWDAYQDYGNRTSYLYSFAGGGWNSETFKPKYPVIASGSLTNTFCSSNITETPPDLDISRCTSAQYTFANSTKIKAIPIFDCSSMKSLEYTFYYCPALETLNIVGLKENCTFTAPFSYCDKLVNLSIEGTIGTKISFSQCTSLSKASITSIINALSSATSGLSCTLSQVAVNNAFTDAEWSALIATKTNWTISLV